MRKYSVILGNLGNTCDRFLSSGYKEPLDKAKMIRQAASIEGVKGIELVGSWDIDRENAGEMKKALRKTGLECVSIIPDLFAQKRWGKGALASADKEIRKAAVAEIKSMVDVAVALHCGLLNVWPGQDGYDYALSADYVQERKWLAESLYEASKYALKKGVRIALVLKIKEPRCRYLAGSSDTCIAARDPKPALKT
jgi:xylose isomerase